VYDTLEALGIRLRYPVRRAAAFGAAQIPFASCLEIELVAQVTRVPHAA